MNIPIFSNKDDFGVIILRNPMQLYTLLILLIVQDLMRQERNFGD